jgi:hypothetical protein
MAVIDSAGFQSSQGLRVEYFSPASDLFSGPAAAI